MSNAVEPAAPPRRENILRRLYHWVLHWADTPYGTPALAIISFAESSFFPIPPDVLQIALSVSQPRRSFYYAAVSAVASVCGGVAGYYIGALFWTVMSSFFFNYVPGFSARILPRSKRRITATRSWRSSLPPSRRFRTKSSPLRRRVSSPARHADPRQRPRAQRSFLPSRDGDLLLRRASEALLGEVFRAGDARVVRLGSGRLCGD